MDAKKQLEKDHGKQTFSRSLKAWRMGEEMSQDELADAAGLSKTAISRFENGHDFPSAETLNILAKVLNADATLWTVYIVRDMAKKKGFHGIEVRLDKAVG